MSSDTQPLRPPPAYLLALEGRTGFELLASLAALPLLALAPAGDGHPVLVMPGWLASDRSTLLLRWFLRRRGYYTYGWRLGANRGPSPEIVQGLARRFLAIRERHGRKVSLIGWSLGGIYARELARHFSGDVRQVITLASPFRDVTASNTGGLARLFRFLNGERREVDDRHDLRQRIGEPLAVPTTSIYSRSDGIVAWRSCIEEEGPLRQNIEVVSSHIGMGHHPAALAVIGDRLAQPEDAWQPFRRRFWPGVAVTAA